MLVTPFSGSQTNMGLECKAGHLTQAPIITRFNVKPLITSLANAVSNVAKKIEILETGINYGLVSQLI